MRLNRDKVSWGLRRCVILAPIPRPGLRSWPLLSLSLAALGVNWENMIRLGTLSGHLALEKVNFAKDSFLLRLSVNTKPFSGVINFNIQSLCLFWTLICSIIPSYLTAVPLTGMWEDLFCNVWYFISKFLCPVHLMELLWRCATGHWRVLGVCDWVMQVNTDQDPSLVAT